MQRRAGIPAVAVGREVDRDAPRGGGFSYDLKVVPDHTMTLMCTYWASSIIPAREKSIDGLTVYTMPERVD